MDAVEWCFLDILDDIEKTRTPYPGEIEARGSDAKGQKASGQVDTAELVQLN